MKTLGRVLPLICLVASSTHAADFFVSPHGKDDDPGTREKPFATITRARDAARSIQGESITIHLRRGTHYLAEPVELSHEDSGTAEHPVVYTSFENEPVTISGGEHLELEFEPYRDGIVRAKVRPEFTTDQLFLGGARLHMARYPNYDSDAQHFNGSAADCISRERAARWKNPKGGFFHAMHSAHWGDMHYRITGKNAKGEVQYEGGWQNNRKSRPHRDHRFVENIFEELDAPGEWFLDEENDLLYLFPRGGWVPRPESKRKLESVHLEQLFILRGTRERPVRHVSLRGLTLTHTARTFMKNREPLLRSDWTTWRGGAVFLEGTEDCRLENLTLRKVGSNAIFVNRYNRRVTISGTHVVDAGASSVSFVGSPKALRSPLFEYNEKSTFDDMDRTPGPRSPDYPAQCTVDDCLLTRNGRFEKQTAGVNICMAEEITVRRSTINDVPRAGINICDGAFGGHLLEHCDVFNTVRETGDHGSFNSWGRDRFWHANRGTTEAWVRKAPDMPTWDARKRTIIRHNRWRCDLGWDIDLDDGSSNYHIYNNLCLSGGIKLREGYRRVVENNVLVNNTFHPHVWYEKSESIFRRNIIFAPHAPAGMKPQNYGPGVDDNFLHVDGAEVGPATELQKISRADTRSLRGDALFVDEEKADYRVREDSPARKIGFENFPMAGFGVVSERLKNFAREPILPGSPEELGIVNRGWGQSKVLSPHKKSRRTLWAGATVRNVQTEGDKSAAGLDSIRGVLVLKVRKGSLADRLGLKPLDVILGGAQSNGELLGIEGMREFAEVFGFYRGDIRMRIRVWRDQNEILLEGRS